MAIELGGIGGAAGIFVVLVIIFMITRYSSEHRALYGTRRERKLEQEEGLGNVAKAFRALESRLKRGKE